MSTDPQEMTSMPPQLRDYKKWKVWGLLGLQKLTGCYYQHQYQPGLLFSVTREFVRWMALKETLNSKYDPITGVHFVFFNGPAAYISAGLLETIAFELQKLITNSIKIKNMK